MPEYNAVPKRIELIMFNPNVAMIVGFVWLRMLNLGINIDHSLPPVWMAVVT
ncbi:hypothetical protein D3C85_1685180 [compost metagenome]